ncbi:MAG: glycosyltransferase [Smithellaceae bacterium]|nr:glycosyltransferase [Smithellaceae bacterium]
MKIVIFFSSIGQGHISAAQAIEKEITRQDPSVIVLKKDIRAFMDPMRRVLDEKLYWFIAKNLPGLFDYLFTSLQEKGNSAGSLSSLPHDYPEEKVIEYLNAEAPDAILATHYGSAQVLGNLREKGLLPGIKIGWLHTDYFEGYFPRISLRIDRTFLAHPELTSRWLAAGIPPELIETTGMPVNVPGGTEAGGKRCLERLDFVPEIKTITIASGKEGAADFAGVVESIAAHTTESLQVIAVCGCNEKQRRALEKLQRRLSSLVRLEILGFIPQADLVSFIYASDLFITKAGGLSPAEAFTLGKPTILLNVISGHERENAELFSKLGMARFNTDVKEVGAQVLELLHDRDKQAAMLAAQQEFQANMDIGKIARFALDESIKARLPEADFGVEKGLAVRNAEEALARLEADAPADVEVLLSYSTSKQDERIVMENPFGHIALRVGATVYSSNHMTRSEEGPLLQNLGLAEYLFGVEPPVGSQDHTSTYGMAYGRDTLGLRVAGVAPASLERMHAEAAKIEEEFRAGECNWNRIKANCADFVVRILHAGGYRLQYMEGPVSVVTMPLDIFDRARSAFEDDLHCETELVAYRRLPGSQASYRFSRFPLSLGQPVRALTQIITNTDPEKIEKAVKRQLTGYFGDDRIYYENLNKRLSTSAADDLDRSRKKARRIEGVLFEEMKQLITARQMMQFAAYKEKIDRQVTREFIFLIERCYDVARISMEHAEGIITGQNGLTLRSAFEDLMGEYGALNFRERQTEQLSQFISKLSEFQSVIEKGLSEAGQKRHELAAEVSAVLGAIERRFKDSFDLTAAPLRKALKMTRGKKDPSVAPVHRSANGAKSGRGKGAS